MKFLRVNPTTFEVIEAHADSVFDVDKPLHQSGTDFGTVWVDHGGGGVQIIVYESGLMEGDGPYFSINHKLYSGNAVLFRFDDHGETVDMGDWKPEVLWLPTKTQVEMAINCGAVARPVAAVNGVVHWRWNE
jgi:hypothetical protein